MTRDVSSYLDDILKSIKKLQSYSKGKSKEDFLKNEQLQDAILRRLEVIGEAAKAVQRMSERSIPPSMEEDSGISRCAYP